jgi:hypothetical protein
MTALALQFRAHRVASVLSRTASHALFTTTHAPLGNMRANGVRTLAAWCLGRSYNRRFILCVSNYPDAVAVVTRALTRCRIGMGMPSSVYLDTSMVLSDPCQ